MTVNPVDLVTARAQGAPATSEVPTAAPTGAPAAPPADGPDPQQLLAAKQGLDQRADAWNAIASAPSTAGTGSDGAPVASDVADKTGDNVTDQELQRIFGDEADNARQILQTHSDVTVSQLLPLAKDPNGLENVTQLMTNRTDLNIDDVLTKSPDGQVFVNPTVSDTDSRDLMVKRQDVKPGDLSKMAQTFAGILRDPGLAREAYGKSLDLLTHRTDVKPADLANMMNSISNSVNGNTIASGNGNTSTILDMFEKGTQLMRVRKDIKPEDVAKLAATTANDFGSKKDAGSGHNIDNAFDTATQLLTSRKDMSTDDVGGLMDSVKQHFPGDDAGSGANRLSVFEKSAQLLTATPQLKAQGVEAMLDKSAQGPPPQQGNNLWKAFSSAGDDLMQGRTNVAAATTPRAQQTDQQVRQEKALTKENRIQAGRLPDPQEEEDTKKGRNDATGKTNAAGPAGAPPDPHSKPLDNVGTPNAATPGAIPQKRGIAGQ